MVVWFSSLSIRCERKVLIRPCRQVSVEPPAYVRCQAGGSPEQQVTVLSPVNQVHLGYSILGITSRHIAWHVSGVWWRASGYLSPPPVVGGGV